MPAGIDFSKQGSEFRATVARMEDEVEGTRKARVAEHNKYKQVVPGRIRRAPFGRAQEQFMQPLKFEYEDSWLGRIGNGQNSPS